MTDLLRKAVELADGWRLSERGHIIYPSWHSHIGYSLEETVPEWVLDALAAQLVRQIDSLSHKMGITVWMDSQRSVVATIVHPRGIGSQHFLGVGEGDDRTMNTIKAIVESGVLE